jgi:hypothetical protein
VNRSERSRKRRTEPFRFTVDQYGRLWLHAKLEGIEVGIDLAEKEQAFQVMASAMDEHGFELRAAREEHHGRADNDDEQGC